MTSAAATLEALRVIEEMHKELRLEHDALPPNWFGGPRKRHNEIMLEASALLEISRRLRRGVSRQ